MTRNVSGKKFHAVNTKQIQEDAAAKPGKAKGGEAGSAAVIREAFSQVSSNGGPRNAMFPPAAPAVASNASPELSDDEIAGLGVFDRLASQKEMIGKLGDSNDTAAVDPMDRLIHDLMKIS